MLHRRSGDDGGYRNPLVAIHIAIDTREVEQERRETNEEQGQHHCEGDKKLLSDGEMAEPAGERSLHAATLSQGRYWCQQPAAALSQFPDGPEQQNDGDFLSHRRGREPQCGDLVELIVRGVVSKNYESRFLCHWVPFVIQAVRTASGDRARHCG